jgi:excisionase family DNA binding protein
MKANCPACGRPLATAHGAGYLSVAEVAELLAVDHKTVRRLIESGALPALRVGRVIRVDPVELARLSYPERQGPGRVGSRRPRDPRGEFSRLARARGTVNTRS